MEICSIPGCGKTERSFGWCDMHYMRWHRNGDPLKTKRSPPGNGFTDKDGYKRAFRTGKLEHHVIVERVLGREIRYPEEIHHVDGNRDNNAPTNLVICPNRAYHRLLHVRQKALEECGNADFLKCPYCKKYDHPSNMLMKKTKNCVAHHKECHYAYNREYCRTRRKPKLKNNPPDNRILVG